MSVGVIFFANSLNQAGYHGLSPGLEEDIPGLPFPVTSGSSTDPELGIRSARRINWTSEKTIPVENPLFASYQYSPAVQKAIESILYIADHIKKDDDDNNVSNTKTLFLFIVFTLFSFFVVTKGY